MIKSRHRVDPELDDDSPSPAMNPDVDDMAGPVEWATASGVGAEPGFPESSPASEDEDLTVTSGMGPEEEVPVRPRSLRDARTAELDAIQIYLRDIEYRPLLTPEEERKYARLAREGDAAGRRRMIECNLRLVVKIARRYLNRG
ncbi:MAG: RNA polymerase sigma factor RpoS, partial [Thioalkalivibrio sp.]|nr:RNA polymerase sigma factor RpoS [Thioalkalivibrio sp.]